MVIFEFNCNYYNDRSVIENVSYEICERLANIDEDNITKYTNDEIQNAFNDTTFDIENAYYRVFPNKA